MSEGSACRENEMILHLLVFKRILHVLHQGEALLRSVCSNELSVRISRHCSINNAMIFEQPNT